MRTCPTKWPQPRGPTCSAARPTRGQSLWMRSATSPGRPGANTAANRPTPSRSSGLRRRSSSAVGGEEARWVAAGAEASVGGRVADQLRGVPELLAVGKATLEFLETVPALDAATEVKRKAE